VPSDIASRGEGHDSSFAESLTSQQVNFSVQERLTWDGLWDNPQLGDQTDVAKKRGVLYLKAWQPPVKETS
jgi:hypothetical protein